MTPRIGCRPLSTGSRNITRLTSVLIGQKDSSPSPTENMSPQTPGSNMIRIFILKSESCCLFIYFIFAMAVWMWIILLHVSSWSDCLVYLDFYGMYLSPRIQVSCLLQVCGVQWNGSSLHHVSKQASSFLQRWVSGTDQSLFTNRISAWLKDTLMTCSVQDLFGAALNRWPLYRRILIRRTA